MDPLAVPPDDARLALKIGTTKLYELINDGELESFKIGRATRITTESIRAYVNRQLQREAS